MSSDWFVCLGCGAVIEPKEIADWTFSGPMCRHCVRPLDRKGQKTIYDSAFGDG